MSIQNPFLSIITINRNNAAGLRKTLESVRIQTCKNYEHIIIDGASTDESVDVIKEFLQDKDYAEHVTYWCSEKDGGVYNAQNKGLLHACGEYVNFMNAGDCFASETTLETVFCKKRNADIIYGYMMRKTLDGIPHNIPSMKKNITWVDFYFDTLPHQSSYIKRHLFSVVGYYDESYPRLADWKWFLMAVSLYNATLEFIPEKLSVYECGGISEDEYWKEDLVRLRKEFYPPFMASKDFENIRLLNFIYERWFTRILFKIIKRITLILNRRKQKRDFDNVRFRKIK